MSYNNTYSNEIGSYSNNRSSGSMSGTGNFLNWLGNDRKDPVNSRKDFKGMGESQTSGDAGFLRSTLGSFGSRPNKKQLFQSAAYEGERRRDFHLRHTTGNLGDILRNLNFDKQPKQQQQELPISNKYSGENTKTGTNPTFSINSPSKNTQPALDFRKQRYMQSTVYQSHPSTNYEPYTPPIQQKKQQSASFVSGGKRFDIDEMFNKIKRQKQLESELKRLREEKRMRQQGWKEKQNGKDGERQREVQKQKQKDRERERERQRQRQKQRQKQRQRQRERERERERERQRQRQRQKLSTNTSSSLSTFIGSQKFTNTFSSSTSKYPLFYPKPPSQQHSSYTNTSYTARTQTADNSNNQYDKKYVGFGKKQRYGAYTPKREYEFEKKMYQFEKKYDTAGKKQYQWKNIKTTPYQSQHISSYTSRTPAQKSKNTSSTTTSTTLKDDKLSKYFLSSSSISSNQKVQRFDCKVTIRDFRLGKQLGEGKFGTVYQAVHKLTNSLYAIKKVPKSIIKSYYMIDQFILQIKLQSFMSNQHILALHGFFHDSQNIYLILDYMQQGTLYTILKKNKRLEYDDAAIKIKQISKGIIYMHENGIAHRDIKPENVVISNGSCKLCDFGWSTICDQRRKTYCGTFDYAAPQILQGAQYDMSVDLWCLGVMAYELLVGKAPFYHIKKQETKKRILNVQSQPITYPADMPKDAVDFIERLLKKNPQQRIKNQQLLYHPFLANA